MPQKRIVQPLAAGEINRNVVAGVVFEFSGPFTHVNLYAIANGTGIAEGDVVLDMSFTNVGVIDPSAVPIAATGPDRDKHLLGGGVMRPTQRLVISAQNLDAVNAAVLILLIDWTELQS